MEGLLTTIEKFTPKKQYISLCKNHSNKTRLFASQRTSTNRPSIHWGSASARTWRFHPTGDVSFQGFQPTGPPEPLRARRRRSQIRSLRKFVLKMYWKFVWIHRNVIWLFFNAKQPLARPSFTITTLEWSPDDGHTHSCGKANDSPGAAQHR